MCFGFIKIWRRKLRKPSVNTEEKPIQAWASTTSTTSTTSRPSLAPAYKPPRSLGLDVNTAAMDSMPPAKNENPLVTAPPSKTTPSTNYLSAPKVSYGSGAKSHSSTSNTHSGGTASATFGSASYSVGSYDYGSSSVSSSGGGGGCGSSSSGGGGCGSSSSGGGGGGSSSSGGGGGGC